jgi:bifunctional polynucleotide phosphatase/kinase
MNPEIFCKNPTIEAYKELSDKAKKYFFMFATLCKMHDIGDIVLATMIIDYQTSDWVKKDTYYTQTFTPLSHKVQHKVPLRLAMYDLDGTLMNNDKPIDKMIQHAIQCHSDGYHLVVISNQYGITKGHTNHNEVQERFKLLHTFLKNPNRVIYMYATEKDKYRKPMTGMYDEIVNNRDMVHSDSFYCGDAIGRSSDFAVSDYYFAQNCGVRCLRTPDFKEVQKEMAEKYQLYANLEPMDMWIANGNEHIYLDVSTSPQLVIMIGPQGCGKSTLSKKIEENNDNITVLNRDTLKNTNKMKQKFLSCLGKSQSIVLDNTNYSKEKREEYITAAIIKGYRIKIYYFDIPKELSMHMCHMRVQLGGPRIPPVAIHTYYKRLEPPEPGEADEIITIDNKILQYDEPILSEFYMHYNIKER